MATESNDNIITFERYYDPMLAHIVRTRLEDNGIPCFIADENVIAANPMFNNAVGGIKLKIFERDLERCKQILALEGDLHERDHIEIDEDDQAVACPYCASTNVKHRLADDTTSGISGLLSTLSGLLSFKGKSEWYCYNCQREFD
ncbi:DUF2007 domain-containing protein [Mucilaginibacter conchicola]|uniref:DUF2007 domain-containing protein n=1 Tax=Mucilaginibacter conchicola TaxID=2303333 RepID=A0A372NPK4_9SPHI|nr:DUF2007 domain-containing protein [Mucilaginibacter conchicola]RFZ90876.1 DUF2007 domain-containing protein [Mucilaginibacter conchicola]